MSKPIRVYKWYSMDQGEEQEAWLREMAGKGYHLRRFNWMGFAYFEQGEPADVVYRIDASTNASKPDYRQLVKAASPA